MAGPVITMTLAREEGERHKRREGAVDLAAVILDNQERQDMADSEGA